MLDVDSLPLSHGGSPQYTLAAVIGGQQILETSSGLFLASGSTGQVMLSFFW